jgi:hypothetical protein
LDQFEKAEDGRNKETVTNLLGRPSAYHPTTEKNPRTTDEDPGQEKMKTAKGKTFVSPFSARSVCLFKDDHDMARLSEH